MPVRPVLQLGDPLCGKRPSVEDPSARRSQDWSPISPTRSPTGAPRPATDAASPLRRLGVLQRVIFLKLPGAKPWPLINPEIIERSEEKIIVWDACLSFLSIFMQVERHRADHRPLSESQGETLDSKPGTTAISPNCCSMKSTISTASWPSTASSIQDHLHPGRIRKALPRREPYAVRSSYNRKLSRQKILRYWN